MSHTVEVTVSAPGASAVEVIFISSDDDIEVSAAALPPQRTRWEEHPVEVCHPQEPLYNRLHCGGWPAVDKSARAIAIVDKKIMSLNTDQKSGQAAALITQAQQSSNATSRRQNLPFGAVQGQTREGVVAYSCNKRSLEQEAARTGSVPVKPGRSYVNGHYCGLKYQCVEFARRWLILTNSVTFPDVRMAYEIFNLPHFVQLGESQKSTRTQHHSFEAYSAVGQAPGPQLEQNQHLSLHRHRSGSATELPKPGWLLIWKPQGFFRSTGHVAVVTEVTPQYVRVAEQNVSYLKWGDGKEYARQLKVSAGEEDGTFVIEDRHKDTYVLGWIGPSHW